MPRDYAVLHNAQTPEYQNKPKRARRSWMLILFILAIAVLVYRLQPYWRHASPSPVEITKTPATAPTKTSLKPEKSNEPQFDFYTLLPNMKVDVTELTPPPPPPDVLKEVMPNKTENQTSPMLVKNSEKSLEDDKATPVTAAIANEKTHDVSTTPAIDATKKQYYLQLGSFTNAHEAEKLKQQLETEGFPVLIRSVQSPGHQTLNRVWVGPFADLPHAEQHQRKLQTKSHPCILLSMQ